MGRPVARGLTRAVRSEQQRRCYEGLLAGKTYAVLSAELGISEALVSRRVKEAADARVSPLVDQLRDVENDRLDVLLRALQRGIADGDARAIGAAVRVSERRAKLLGLDSPEALSVSLSHAQEDAGALLVDALSAALDAVLDAARPDPRWVSDLRKYGEETARWALLGRVGERPVAPVPPPAPEPAEPGVIEASAVLPGPGSGGPADAALRAALAAFEGEFGPLGEG